MKLVAKVILYLALVVLATVALRRVRVEFDNNRVAERRLAEESRELSRLVAERRFSWTVLLARLEKTLPGDVGVVRLQPVFDKNGEVLLDLQLVARNRDAVVPTIRALSKDPAFGTVELKSESSPEGASVDPFLFQLSSLYALEPRR